MTEHYFSETPNVASQPKRISVDARGVHLSLQTDAGVFSKDALDRGTQVLVETVELGSAATVVDLGCGYGPVTAILATVYPDSSWVMVDVNRRALDLAKTNTSAYGDRVTHVLSDGFEQIPDLSCTDVILNPPIRAGKAVVYRLFREAREHLQPGGALWVVIQKKHGAPSALKYLSGVFDNVEIRYKKSGYNVFRCF